MAKCLECFHWKACYNGKDWDAEVGDTCDYFVADADAAVVVECRNCKHYDCGTMSCISESDGRYWFPDDFCSYGIRADNG